MIITIIIAILIVIIIVRDKIREKGHQTHWLKLNKPILKLIIRTPRPTPSPYAILTSSGKQLYKRKVHHGTEI